LTILVLTATLLFGQVTYKIKAPLTNRIIVTNNDTFIIVPYSAIKYSNKMFIEKDLYKRELERIGIVVINKDLEIGQLQGKIYTYMEKEDNYNTIILKLEDNVLYYEKINTNLQIKIKRQRYVLGGAVIVTAVIVKLFTL
jgi:hypothetical protein